VSAPSSETVVERLDLDGTVVVTLERPTVPRRSAAKALLTARLPKRPKKAARKPNPRG